MTPKKAYTWVGVAAVVFFLLRSPADAQDIVGSAFDGIESAANQFATFVKSIV
jgi:hypothetical protein